MSARPKLTLGWKGKTEPVPDIVFVDVTDCLPLPAAPVTAATPAPEYMGKQIGLRLENWARWCDPRNGGGGGGASCMTGALCDQLRKEVEGSPSTQGWRNPVDSNDAVRIEVAMRAITEYQRTLLGWCYIEQARPEMIMLKMSIPDARAFVDLFNAAQAAVEAAAR